MPGFPGRSGVPQRITRRVYRPFRVPIPTAPPVCGGTDTFTGPDGAFTGTDTDLDWTVFLPQNPGTRYVITSNQLALIAESPFDVPSLRCDTTPCTARQFAQFDWIDQPDDMGSSFISLIIALRITNQGDGEWYTGGTTNGMAWFEFIWNGVGFGGMDFDSYVYDDDGTGHESGFDTDLFPGDPVVGSTFRCEVDHLATPNMSMFRDDVLVWSTTNAFLTDVNPSGLYTGIFMGGLFSSPGTYANTIDNWVCGDL